jgi:hypothetical protein
MRNYCNTSLSRWEKDGLSYRRYDNSTGPNSKSSRQNVKGYLMVVFLHGFAHLYETNAEARELQERIAENVVKLLEGK